MYSQITATSDWPRFFCTLGVFVFSYSAILSTNCTVQCSQLLEINVVREIDLSLDSHIISKLWSIMGLKWAPWGITRAY